jgi:hypothetical protein
VTVEFEKEKMRTKSTQPARDVESGTLQIKTKVEIKKKNGKMGCSE